MDSQVASYWMFQQEGNTSAADKCKQDAIDASMNSSVPCVFTKTVAYETSDSPSDNNKKTGKLMFREIEFNNFIYWNRYCSLLLHMQ